MLGYNDVSIHLSWRFTNVEQQLHQKVTICRFWFLCQNWHTFVHLLVQQRIRKGTTKKAWTRILTPRDSNKLQHFNILQMDWFLLKCEEYNVLPVESLPLWYNEISSLQTACPHLNHRKHRWPVTSHLAGGWHRRYVDFNHSPFRNGELTRPKI